MRTEQLQIERPEMAAMVTVQNPRGYDGTYWYTAHESQVTDNLVVDFNRTSDVFNGLYSPVMYDILRHEHVKHLELAAEPFGERTRLIGRPVDTDDWPLKGGKHHPLGWLDLRLVGFRETAMPTSWGAKYYLDFVLPTLDIRENWRNRLWLRFVYPPDWEA
ncbi:MAG: hypothetical protein ACREGB_03420 [Candidatus Saccharimonadales bacterium]